MITNLVQVTALELSHSFEKPHYPWVVHDSVELDERSNDLDDHVFFVMAPFCRSKDAKKKE
jgi:hypothetical protein